MIKTSRRVTTELAVIGAGITGCAATVFALSRGIKTTQIGNTGALAYTSGFFDLLGIQNGEAIENPWTALDTLRKTEPEHPFSKVSNDEIKSAFEEFITAVDSMGLTYTHPGENNHIALLPAGACKPTFCMPGTMQQVELALAEKARVLIIDFAGLQGFSAKEIVANLASEWPQLRAERVTFPDIDTTAQVFPEVLARALEVPDTRKEFAKIIKTVLGDADYVAMPAILGIHNVDLIHREMEQMIGVPVFEIPTIPPAVAGIRLRELFEQQLAEHGATVITQQVVKIVSFEKENIHLKFDDNFGPVVVEAERILLASGRFLSGGLVAEQHHIREALMDIPVSQPADRNDWFSESYFDPEGHAVNRAGLNINNNFQPLNLKGQLFDERLYAAGILLANQDWIRQRCGAGLAIATAYKAITAMKENW